MSNLIYFRPRKYMNEEDRLVIKFIPRNKDEGYRADLAEDKLPSDLYIKFLAMTITHGAYDLLPERHKENIKELTETGMMDALTTLAGLNLCISYVNDGRFFFKGEEIKLPDNFIPASRQEVEDVKVPILVKAFRGDEQRVYKFLHYNEKKYRWVRV